MSRQQICAQTSEKLAAASGNLPKIKAMIGLDGFVDEIIAVVDKRQNYQQYDPIRTIETFGKKIYNAAGQSSNYELVVKQTKIGGNGPIMANAMAAAGVAVTYVGALGYPEINPVFAELKSRARQIFSFCDPAHTDALEFDDGKLMLGKHTPFLECNWDNLVGRVGKAKLVELITESSLIGNVNWTMLPHLSDIWKHLAEEILPLVPRGDRQLFVDLTDPEKRTAEDLSNAMSTLNQFQKQMDTMLGLNLKESTQVAEVLGIPLPANPEGAIEQTARAIRERLGLSCVVVHPRKGGAAATAQGSATFIGPFVQHPKISTGAGDHFNAGFALGRVLDFGLEECLCTAVATSGFYVREAKSPSAAELVEFIADLPQPEAA